MLKDFFGHKYVIWSADKTKLNALREHTSFNQYIKNSFNAAAANPGNRPPQAIGDANSIKIPEKYHDLLINAFMPPKYHGSLVSAFMPPHLKIFFQEIGIKNLSQIVGGRCWVNRMYYGSSGKIHNHYNKDLNAELKICVLIFYYNVPEKNSANLILINPDVFHKSPKDSLGNMIATVDEVDEVDKLQINVFQDMCVLHDGKIAHGVSQHNNESPRDAIIMELMFKN